MSPETINYEELVRAWAVSLLIPHGDKFPAASDLCRYADILTRYVLSGIDLADEA